MADPLSAVASIVGIVGFGIQVAKTLQKEIDDISTATERVQQIVVEIRATSAGLTGLKELLLEDAKDPDNQVFNDEGRSEVDYMVRHCNNVFRKITVLVAKAGHRVLSQVDLYQRRIEARHNEVKGGDDDEVKLEIELSNLEHLMLPWRLPKIQQYLADMDRLKLSMVLIVSVANLAKARQQKLISMDSSDTASDKWDGSDSETLVQDEIFYQDQGLREAEEKLQTLIDGPSAPNLSSRPDNAAAHLVLQSWPHSASGHGLCTVGELHGAGVTLESHSFNLRNMSELTYQMPFNLHKIQQQALRGRHWATKQPANVWDIFAGLHTYQKNSLLNFLRTQERSLYGPDVDQSSPYLQLVLVSLHINNFRRRRLLDLVRRVITSDKTSPRLKPMLFVITARVTDVNGKRGNARAFSLVPESVESDGYSSAYGGDSDVIIRRRGRWRNRFRRRLSSDYSRSRSSSLTRKPSLGALARRMAFWPRKKRERRKYGRSRSRVWTDSTDRVAEDDLCDRDSKTPLEKSILPRRDADTEIFIERRGGDRSMTTRTGPHDDARRAVRADSSEVPPGSQMPSRKATQVEQIADIPPLRRRTTTFRMDGDDEIQSKPSAPNKLALSRIPITPGKMSERLRLEDSRKEKPTEPALPVYIKVNRKWIVPETLDLYELPWEWSVDDPNYIIIKRWIPEKEQDLLFDHTRMLRARGAIAGNGSSSEGIIIDDRPRRNRRARGHGDYDTSLSPIRDRTVRRGRNSRREPGSGNLKLISSSPHRPTVRNFEDDGVPPSQRDKAAVAEYYLKKWTTVYDQVVAESRRTRNRTNNRSRSRSRRRPRPRGDKGRSALMGYQNEPIHSRGDAGAGAKDGDHQSGAYPLVIRRPTFRDYDEEMEVARAARRRGKRIIRKSSDDEKQVKRDDQEQVKQDDEEQATRDDDGDSFTRRRSDDDGEEQRKDSGEGNNKRNEHEETSLQEKPVDDQQKEGDSKDFLEVPSNDQQAYAESVSDVGVVNDRENEEKAVKKDSGA